MAQSAAQSAQNDKTDQLDLIRHSLAHVMAAAVSALYPGAQFGVGPTITDGFYYDLYLEGQTISDTDLVRIEQKMREIIKRSEDFVREEWSMAEARAYFAEHKQGFKVELLDDLAAHGTTKADEINARELGVGEVGRHDGKNDAQITTVTVYRTGDFVDLCRGPHVTNTRELAKSAFQLTKVSGAYWRGDEKRAQMQRVYGVAFETKAELEQFELNQAEALARDHRKLGQELDLFTFSDLVGPGLPMYTPRGTIIRTEIQNALLEISQKYGMQSVSIPHLAKLELYKISGHAEKFDDELFRVKSHYNQEFILKPVNCPHHTQIYAGRPRSYRDLPLRLMESTMQYRDEKPGEIGGLTRTRGFTVDDGHIFCTVDQIKAEATNIVHIIREFYSNLEMWGDHWVSLSLRDPRTPEKYIGEPADWKASEEMLAEISREQKLDAKPMEGEAALYGPKLDFMFRDALGNERQLATIQIDFAMPKRFDLRYIDSDGSAKHPVMIHRAILGSFERFMAILIEHYAGAFPVWLAPEQVRVVPISDKTRDYAVRITTILAEHGIRYELDNSGQSLGKRIRNAETMKVPYTLILGEKEASTDTVAIRHYHDGDRGAIKIEDFLAQINSEIYERSNN